MKKELGKWILDVTKYVATAGLIAPFLTRVDSVWWYIGLVVAVMTMLILGLLLVSGETETKKNN